MLDLNNTLVSVRERSLSEICDLALRVSMQHFRPLALAAIVGILPWAVLDTLLCWLLIPDIESHRFKYTNIIVLLNFWQIPLATAPITLILGQIMFQKTVDAKRAWQDFKQSLPQMLWSQFFLRLLCIPHGVLILLFPNNSDLAVLYVFLAFLWLVPALRWAYLNEVILLERNPWRAKPGQLSTRQRNTALHTGEGGIIFGRGFGISMIWSQMSFTMFGVIWYLLGQFHHSYVMNFWTLVVIFPLANWITIVYLTVVRFMCYLDLRIRREGWEVDLILRTEAERLLKPIIENRTDPLGQKTAMKITTNNPQEVTSI